MDENLNDKTYHVLDLLASGRELSQRELAQHAGLSLGMVNLILKRLVKTGYIKVAGLDSKKINYILTAKGLSQRMVRSYQYFQRAYRTFHQSQLRIESLLDSLVAKGHRHFVVLGDGEVSGIVEVALKERANGTLQIRRAREESPDLKAGEVVLDCRLGRNSEAVGISVLEAILGPGTMQENAIPSKESAI